jgi:hypothetical protein
MSFASTVGKCMVKASEGDMLDGYSRHAFQNFMPAVKRRELDDDEQAMVARESKKWFPKIIRSEGDTLAADLSSPGKTALMTGGLGALFGGAGGGLVGGNIGTAFGNPLLGAGVGAGVGLLGGGGIGGLLGYLGREAANNTIQERMRNMPKGATRFMLESDPRIQAKLERANSRRNNMMLAAALGGLAR